MQRNKKWMESAASMKDAYCSTPVHDWIKWFIILHCDCEIYSFSLRFLVLAEMWTKVIFSPSMDLHLLCGLLIVAIFVWYQKWRLICEALDVEINFFLTGTIVPGVKSWQHHFSWKALLFPYLLTLTGRGVGAVHQNKKTMHWNWIAPIFV